MVNSSVLAMTSVFEGFGVVLIEAMSVGLPVVSYACPCGPKDVITNGKDGFLVPLEDEIVLAERLCSLIENDSLRREMGQEALENVKRFSIETVVGQWMDLFRKLVEDR